MIILIKKPKTLKVGIKTFSDPEWAKDPNWIACKLKNNTKIILPKNTLKMQLIELKQGLDGNDFVMNLITTVATYKVYTFKRK